MRREEGVLLEVTQFLQTVAIWALPLLLAITLHEAAHAYAARELGDPTAALLGRVTLNPLRHIDPFGTVVLPLILLLTQVGIVFGYAKPVPVDPRNLRDPRGGMALVALAGPASNLIQAAAAVVILRLALENGLSADSPLRSLLTVMVYINCLLAVLNMLPIPPLDGGRILVALLPPQAGAALEGFSRKGIWLLLAIFFLLPLFSRQAGLSIDPLAWFVGEPAVALTHLLFRLGGL
ncbi:MAG: site-2 protease family protein [Pseudomonadota bacterium]